MITKCTTSVNNITNLGTTAFERNMTTEQVKAEFDKSAAGIKTFLNETLIPELESIADGTSGADKIGSTALKLNGSTTVGGQLDELKTEVGLKLNSADTKIYTQAEKDKLANVQPGANNYTLPMASNAVLGGVKQGTGVEILSDGTINGLSAPAPDLIARDQIAQEIIDRQSADTVLSQQLTNCDYNIYQLMLQNYYDGKYPLKRGLFFDGFIDSAVIDSTMSTVNIDTVNKKISSVLLKYIDQPSGTDGHYIGADATNYIKIAQTFYLQNPTIISSIDVLLRKEGNPTDGVACKIYNVSAGKPTTELSSSSTVIPSSSINTTAKSFRFNFNTNLQAGNYAIVLERTGVISGTNTFIVSGGTGSLATYAGGNELDLSSSGWIASTTQDLIFSINIITSVQNPVYQSKEQIFSQNIDKAVLYVKSKTTIGCSVSAECSIYTGTETFVPMTKESTRDLGGGYQEDKFTYSTVTSGTKVKVKITLNRPNTITDYEVNQYGCMLGVL